eukprot:CAMPEP_0168341500 /NCGR_PEP_ID=MMETSP0213-20121227/14735_1 /TAXON_ID=151035 /ORGANISM="Euplotes harpa, Strain FSP1.4" /LENGTH=99 /DNA_ID=CAMNT_0008348017 /DNA_START=655 /DNA_END=954 /DNA_ORIENTATION=+
MKKLNKSLRKKRSEFDIESMENSQQIEMRNLIYNFGKTMLNMLFSNVNTFKLVVKLLPQSKINFLLNNILQEDLRDFIMGDDRFGSRSARIDTESAQTF